VLAECGRRAEFVETRTSEEIRSGAVTVGLVAIDDETRSGEDGCGSDIRSATWAQPDRAGPRIELEQHVRESMNRPTPAMRIAAAVNRQRLKRSPAT